MKKLENLIVMNMLEMFSNSVNENARKRDHHNNNSHVAGYPSSVVTFNFVNENANNFICTYIF